MPVSVVEPVPPTETASVDVETSDVPLKYTGCPVVNDVAFVPPFAIDNVPVISLDARFTADEESTPDAFACKIPVESPENVMVPEDVRPADESAPAIVSAPAEVSEFDDEKNWIAPVPPPP